MYDAYLDSEFLGDANHSPMLKSPAEILTPEEKNHGTDTEPINGDRLLLIAQPSAFGTDN